FAVLRRTGKLSRGQNMNRVSGCADAAPRLDRGDDQLTATRHHLLSTETTAPALAETLAETTTGWSGHHLPALDRDDGLISGRRFRLPSWGLRFGQRSENTSTFF